MTEWARALARSSKTTLTRRQAAVVVAIVVVGAASTGVALLAGTAATVVVSIGMQVLILLAVFALRLDLIHRYKGFSTTLDATLQEVRATLAQLQDVSPMMSVLDVVGQDRVETIMRLELLQRSQAATAGTLAALSERTESLATAVAAVGAHARNESQQRVVDT